MGSLLKSQVDHMREAESKLPLKYRNQIETYVKAVRTEGEAARYIQAVTKAIHLAHEDAERDRRAPRPVPVAKPVIEIAAVADASELKPKRTRKRPPSKSKKGAGPKRRRK
jgi:hypothetical protein